MRNLFNRLWVRLSLAFLVVAWLAIGAIALIINTTTERSFRHYLNQRDSSFFGEETVQALEAYYAESGSWEGVEALLPGPRGGGEGGGAGAGAGSGAGAGRGRGGAQVLLADAGGVVVAATDTARLGERLDADAQDRAIALQVDGARVGWLAQETPGTQALGAAESQFLSETSRWLVVGAAGAALLAVIVGVALAWQISRPMRALTQAAHDLAAGKLGQQVQVRGAQEIAALGEGFNRMSRDLAAGEALRQRMAADIAHELRTPVSVLRGHLEAMLDGVFSLDQAHLAVAHEQTLHLARLVDDLRLLTQAEAGQLPLQRERADLNALAARAAELFEPVAADAEITLTHALAGDLPPVRIDVDRIQQVIGNLLSNALRHTPPGGTITLRAWQAGETVRCAVINSGAGLTPEEAGRVFTPFWRAEAARQRDRGGSGLGLAIARELLALHGGRIWAESHPDRAEFVFELPLAGVGA